MNSNHREKNDFHLFHNNQKSFLSSFNFQSQAILVDMVHRYRVDVSVLHRVLVRRETEALDKCDQAGFQFKKGETTCNTASWTGAKWHEVHEVRLHLVFQKTFRSEFI